MKNNKPNDFDLARKFLSMKTVADLSTLINIDFEDIWLAANQPLYRSFHIPKKRGGYREIEAPWAKTKLIQQALNFYLQKVYAFYLPDNNFGFIRKSKNAMTRNIRSNAALHVWKKTVVNIDLKDFFHSISASRIRYIFMSAPFDFERDLASCLALLCCYNKRLPMGAHTSPVLSNFACMDFDKQLNMLARKNKLVYSRFADDITFSSDEEIKETVIEEIKAIITENGFRINPDKYRTQRYFNKQSVTGIKVNEKLNVDRTYIRNIRAALHDIEKNGVCKAALKYYKHKPADSNIEQRFFNSLKGKINFVRFVRGEEDEIYRKLQTKFITVFDLEELKC